MPVNFDSALMRSKAIASLDHASFRVYYVLSQHCVELRSTRIATPSFAQLHSAIAPECGGISIGMFRKSLTSLESAGFLKMQMSPALSMSKGLKSSVLLLPFKTYGRRTPDYGLPRPEALSLPKGPNGRIKIFDLLGVRESYPDVPWFDRPVLILEETPDASSAPLPLGEGNKGGEGSVGNAPILDPSPDTVLASSSPSDRNSSIINPQSSIRPNPEPVEGIINSPDAPILWNAFDVPTVDLGTVDEDLLKIPTGQYAIHLRNCGKLPAISESSCPAMLSA